MSRSPRLFFLLPVFLSITLLFSCSSKKEEEVKEIQENDSTSGVSLDSPEGVLFQKGQDLYQSRLYSLASEYFEALRTGYPLGPFSEYADMKVADCRFQQGEYETAAQAYEDYVKNRPASGAVPYALFMAGRSYQLANRGVGRDPAPLENALKFYQRLLTEYPDAFYTLAAAEHQKKAIEDLAAHEQEIISFYKKKDKAGAVEARASSFSTQLNPRLESAQQFAETELNKEKEKQDIEHKLAESAKSVPALPSEPGRGNSTVNAAAAKELKSGRRGQAQLKIGEIRCETAAGVKPRVFVFLNKPISSSSFEKSLAVLKPEQGKLSIKLPGAEIIPFSKDCFGSNDLSVTVDGTIELQTNANARAMLLQHPDRLLIILD